MAGRATKKLKGNTSLGYGVCLLVGGVLAFTAVISWMFQFLTKQTDFDWGVFVIIAFVIMIIGLAVFFIPRFGKTVDEAEVD